MKDLVLDEYGHRVMDRNGYVAIGNDTEGLVVRPSSYRPIAEWLLAKAAEGEGDVQQSQPCPGEDARECGKAAGPWAAALDEIDEYLVGSGYRFVIMKMLEAHEPKATVGAEDTTCQSPENCSRFDHWYECSLCHGYGRVWGRHGVHVPPPPDRLDIEHDLRCVQNWLAELQKSTTERINALESASHWHGENGEIV
jgi:hypothetical protein